jgi:hypothetical protein
MQRLRVYCPTALRYDCAQPLLHHSVTGLRHSFSTALCNGWLTACRRYCITSPLHRCMPACRNYCLTASLHGRLPTFSKLIYCIADLLHCCLTVPPILTPLCLQFDISTYLPVILHAVLPTRQIQLNVNNWVGCIARCSNRAILHCSQPPK